MRRTFQNRVLPEEGVVIDVKSLLRNIETLSRLNKSQQDEIHRLQDRKTLNPILNQNEENEKILKLQQISKNETIKLHEITTKLQLKEQECIEINSQYKRSGQQQEVQYTEMKNINLSQQEEIKMLKEINTTFKKNIEFIQNKHKEILAQHEKVQEERDHLKKTQDIMSLEYTKVTKQLHEYSKEKTANEKEIKVENNIRIEKEKKLKEEKETIRHEKELLSFQLQKQNQQLMQEKTEKTELNRKLKVAVDTMNELRNMNGQMHKDVESMNDGIIVRDTKITLHQTELTKYQDQVCILMTEINLKTLEHKTTNDKNRELEKEIQILNSSSDVTVHALTRARSGRDEALDILHKENKALQDTRAQQETEMTSLQEEFHLLITSNEALKRDMDNLKEEQKENEERKASEDRTATEEKIKNKESEEQNALLLQQRHKKEQEYKISTTKLEKNISTLQENLKACTLQIQKQTTTLFSIGKVKNNLETILDERNRKDEMQREEINQIKQEMIKLQIKYKNAVQHSLPPSTIQLLAQTQTELQCAVDKIVHSELSSEVNYISNNIIIILLPIISVSLRTRV